MNTLIRLASLVPRLKVGNPRWNGEEILKQFRIASQNGAGIVVTPELSLTGYSCGDLFEQKLLLEEANRALTFLCKETASCPSVLIVGLPLPVRSHLFNVVAVLQSGKVQAFVGKTILPNFRDFCEKRYFFSIREFKENSIMRNGEEIPLCGKLVFQVANGFSFGIEIGADRLAVIPPSSFLVQNGAQIILNPAAEPEYLGKETQLQDFIKIRSRQICGAYLHVSGGIHESTSDCVFAGHSVFAINGERVDFNSAFEQESELMYQDLYPAWITAQRRSWSCFNAQETVPAQFCQLDEVPIAPNWDYFSFKKNPFLQHLDDLHNAFAIPAHALARRCAQARSKRLVLGLSGGLDSTLALLICAECCDLLQWDRSAICAVTMPGFGTSDRTKNNACQLAELLGAELRTISIRKAVEQHFQDIGHDPTVMNVVYENSQARERTQILMDIANEENGIVVGTGDLSEIALGWSTFNGDQMSMYCVNGGIPKTLIRAMIEWRAQHCTPKTAEILRDIIATPVSPELLPEAQHTESIIGNYELHDFFLYYFLTYGETPKMLEKLACCAFKDQFSPEEIRRTLRLFLRRFFTQQFKRNPMPDGPKVCAISLSPRGDWRMPSDADMEIWIKSLEDE